LEDGKDVGDTIRTLKLSLIAHQEIRANTSRINEKYFSEMFLSPLFVTRLYEAEFISPPYAVDSHQAKGVQHHQILLAGIPTLDLIEDKKRQAFVGRGLDS
jgi:hypothetical protein